MTIERFKELYEQMEISSEPTIGEIRNVIKIITGFDWTVSYYPSGNDIYDSYRDRFQDDNNSYEAYFKVLHLTNLVYEFSIIVTPNPKPTRFVKQFSNVKLPKRKG